MKLLAAGDERGKNGDAKAAADISKNVKDGGAAAGILRGEGSDGFLLWFCISAVALYEEVPADRCSRWPSRHKIFAIRSRFGLSGEQAIQKINVMKFTKNIGMFLLAIYLIMDGLLGFGLNLGPAIFLLYVVALAAGVFILIGK